MLLIYQSPACSTDLRCIRLFHSGLAEPAARGLPRPGKGRQQYVLYYQRPHAHGQYVPVFTGGILPDLRAGDESPIKNDECSVTNDEFSVENDDISVKNDECLGQALKSPASNSSPEQRIAMLGEELLQVILSLLLIYQSPACFTDLVAGLLIVLTAVQLFYAYVSR